VLIKQIAEALAIKMQLLFLIEHQFGFTKYYYFQLLNNIIL